MQHKALIKTGLHIDGTGPVRKNRFLEFIW